MVLWPATGFGLVRRLKGQRGIEIRLRFRAVNFPVSPNDFGRVQNILKPGYMAKSTGQWLIYLVGLPPPPLTSDLALIWHRCGPHLPSGQRIQKFLFMNLFRM